ncbi:hypothetical protein KAM345_005000 [Aeromonas caviae]|uniref:AAA family ATPase n=1 Tax=Aeromonas caviae TaxID=648 RepID=UPI001CC49B06|nr:AAA family ATPase [Aeromonas caviae]BDA16586.1 hypothetical protein KAM345_005000 [Aeromonas caviae]
MHEDAITLADRCFPVNRDKSPRVGNWKSHTDGRRDARLFGVPVPYGVVVIDHDSYKPDAISKKVLAQNLGISLETLDAAHLQTTRSGGTHYAFTVPHDANIPNTVDVWPGVDIRSAGRGYIASGRGYKDAKGEPIGHAAIDRITCSPLLDTAPLCKRPGLAERTEQVETSTGGTPLEDIKYCLYRLPDTARWEYVGMAVHHASGGSEEAWELFDEWSAQFSGDYNYNINRKRWDSFGKKPGAITMGSLIHWAGVSAHDLPSHGGQVAGDDDLSDEAPRKLSLPLSFGSEGFDRASQYLIKGLLPAECTSSIYGPSGSYKSFLAISWACHIATGKSWDGRRVEKGAVLYVVGEGGTGVPRRIKAWENTHQEKATNLCCVNQPVFVAAPLQVEQLRLAAEHVKQATGLPVALIVIDTLARCFGGADENKASDMGGFIAGCDAVKAATGATVLVVHHSGKDETKGARGSSSFRAALDAEFLVKRETVGAKALVLTCTKQKDAEEAESRAYDLSERFLYTDSDGEDVTSLAVSATGREPIEEEELAEPALSANHQAMYEAVSAVWLESDGVAVWDAVITTMKANGTWDRRRGKEWLGKLEREGLIVVADGEITRPGDE